MNIKELLLDLNFSDEKGVYIPMLSAFILNIKSREDYSNNFILDKIVEYCYFLNQEFKRELFVPCDYKGICMFGDEAKKAMKAGANRDVVDFFDDEYQRAKSNVIFNEIDGDDFFVNDVWDMYQKAFKNIESAINNGYKIYLK